MRRLERLDSPPPPNLFIHIEIYRHTRTCVCIYMLYIIYFYTYISKYINKSVGECLSKPMGKPFTSSFPKRDNSIKNFVQNKETLKMVVTNFSVC